jgi:hypothetical protein
MREQLQVAETAVELRDPLLLDSTAAAAERLLLDLYGPREPSAAALAARLRELRTALPR